MAGKTNQTDQHIIEQAIEQISSGNFDTLSLRKLAKALGLTTGAFYKHFSNKDALLKAVTIELSKRVTKRAEVALNNVTTAKAQLLKLAEVLLTLFADEPDLMNFMFFNPVAQTALTSNQSEFKLLMLTNELIERVRQETGSDVSADVLFVQIWSFIQGYGILIKNKLVIFDPKLLSDTLDEYLGGVKS
ncbi:TetR/AcrR family transcriptional regulator [Lactiplantibacillus mudanjiangensis]|uniref:HTH tetR-type domain-containing protein n=1 Tax=Lactiplantibacillus mudanjiangensis TaxID=1296538 RepID=A0A660DXT9_9LACO|nr:TetR/AcrR family transcriptional regulator [Lactiplantibacillus mudanjiangensis]VDG25546.1 hypothetical protein [Lactobacillus paracollinoides] [Lactiplantibacillus mudanjiangensis]VDG28556.1 hypothetical protein [Lactobacillus paracollinoides] [Lactiplantibacillus mudanjiangensis]